MRPDDRARCLAHAGGARGCGHFWGGHRPRCVSACGLAGVLLALCLSATVFAADPAADTWQLGPVHIVSMQDGAIQADQVITVSGGRIASIAAYDPAAEPRARLVDGDGAWVIPGLAEMHAHVPPRQRGESYVADVLMLFLANGITTIRGMLGEPWHLELRELLRSGQWDGPRLVTSGPSFNGQSVTSPAEAAQQVLDQAAAGYDFLKLHPGLEPGVFAALVQQARASDIPIAGHVSVAVGIEATLAARQATIDHLDGYAQALVPPSSSRYREPPQFFGLNLGADLDASRAPALAAATRESGTWNVPTQSLLEAVAGQRSPAELLARPEMNYISAPLSGEWLQRLVALRADYSAEQRTGLLQARRALILALQRAGAGLLLGSDAPQIMNVPGFSIHEELAYLVAAGLTPLEALQSGTIHVARFLGESAAGQVAPGFLADFVAVGTNPLLDIAATREVVGVARAGRWYSRTELDAALRGVAARKL